MAKKTFVTAEIREASGKFAKVSDILMENIGKERMGFCEACGHEIETHVAVFHPSTGYMYVGKDCAKILTKENSEVILPKAGTKGKDKFNREVIVLDEKFYARFEKLEETFVVYEVYRGIATTRMPNSFIGSIGQQLVNSKQYEGYYCLTIKQYNAIEKMMKERNI